MIPFHKLATTFNNLNLDSGGSGIGIGYYVGGQPVVHKGKDITPYSAACIVKELTCPVMVHFRAASYGTKVTDNACHPFITNDGIFCHNGTIQELTGTGATSDTSLVVRLINHGGFKRVSKNLHDYGVFAILYPQPLDSSKPESVFSVQIAKSREQRFKRPFKFIRWSNALTDGQEVIVGISNPDCMNDSWYDAWQARHAKHSVSIVGEVEEVEARVLVSMRADEYFEVFGEKPPWSGQKEYLVTVEPWMVEACGLEVVTFKGGIMQKGIPAAISAKKQKEARS